MSTRNNDLRAGQTQNAPLPSAENTQQEEVRSQGSLLSFVQPTEFVELPSNGQFYPEGHPLHGQDSVEIRYMTAKEEDILTSKALVTKGLVLDRLLSSILVDKSIAVDDMLIGDKNAVLIAARITGYGNNYEVQVQCPDCGTKFNHSFDLATLQTNEKAELEDIGVTFSGGLFHFTLPKTNVTVGVRPLTGHDEKALAKIEQKKKKYNLPESTLTDMLKTLVVTADGTSDKALIGQFIDIMPAVDSKHLRNTYSMIVPDVDMKQEIACTACGSVSELEVPLTGEFFWPR